MNNQITLDNCYDLADKIKLSYDRLNKKSGNKSWSYLEFNQGMVGDVGDLTKLLMAKSNLRNYDKVDLDSKIEHELCDILWSVLVISKELKIDLAESFPKFANNLHTKLNKTTTYEQ
jgi:MazG nucleotide pyrophosphohydrolase domain